jgi:hypothetical protein
VNDTNEDSTASGEQASVSSASEKNLIRVQLLGGSKAGKTCFIAGLALLNEQSDGETFVLVNDQNSETMAVFNELRQTLSRGRWPAKTSMPSSLRFALKGAANFGPIRKPLRANVQLTDFSGESFTDAMQRGDDNEAALQVRQMLANADFLMVLIDGALVEQGTDFGVSSLVQAVFDRMEANNYDDLDVAVVLTKCDLCTDLTLQTPEGVKQLVEHRCPDIYRFLAESPMTVHYVPLSACGRNATDADGNPIYDQLSPSGYSYLFKSLLSREVRRWVRLFKLLTVVGAALLLTLLGWSFYRSNDVQKQKIPIADLATPLERLPENVFPENFKALQERYAKEFEVAERAINSSSSVDAIKLELEHFKNIPDTHYKIVKAEWETLQKLANQRLEQLLYEVVKDAEKMSPEARQNAIEKYLTSFPQGQWADEVRGMLEDINRAQYLTARGQVKSVAVVSPAGLQEKINRIDELLKVHGEQLGDEREAILKARDLAAGFLSDRQYHCKLVRTSNFDQPRDHEVKIVVDGVELAHFKDSGDVAEKNWGKDFVVNWRAGKPVKVILINTDGIDVFYRNDMAAFESSSQLAIAVLAKASNPTRYLNGFDYLHPLLRIEFKCNELTPESLQLLSDYILPGDKW